jgi:hypothetical protein
MLSHAPLHRIVNEPEGKAPSLLERVASAAGELLGPTYGELVEAVLLSVKKQQLNMYHARILLERTLPSQRPTPVQLPLIDVAADLVEADRRLMAAANVGAISHAEWRTGQECILASWEIRKQARLEEP